MKPTLKAPGTNCLKLEYDQLLSSCAFNCNLRRYSVLLFSGDGGVGGDLDTLRRDGYYFAGMAEHPSLVGTDG